MARNVLALGGLLLLGACAGMPAVENQPRTYLADYLPESEYWAWREETVFRLTMDQPVSPYLRYFEWGGTFGGQQWGVGVTTFEVDSVGWTDSLSVHSPSEFQGPNRKGQVTGYPGWVNDENYDGKINNIDYQSLARQMRKSSWKAADSDIVREWNEYGKAAYKGAVAGAIGGLVKTRDPREIAVFAAAGAIAKMTERAMDQYESSNKPGSVKSRDPFGDFD